MAGLVELLRSLRASAERTRLRLLTICSHGELTVGEITRIIGQSQPRVSRHLKLLCDAGLLDRFREQHWVFYRVPQKGSGAELARCLLAMLSEDDETLRLDRQRMEHVKAERAQLASDYLADYIRHVGDTTLLSEGEEVNHAILDELVGSQIGELLDIGTGTGRILQLLGPQAEHAVGIDISSEMLLVARTNLHAAGLDRCMVRHGNMYRMPFADDSYDTITMDQVLSAAEEPESAVAEAARILKPGGQLLIVDFSQPAEPQEGERSGVSEAMLTGWFEQAGLKCARMRQVRGRTHEVMLSLALQAGGDEGMVA